jgi:hypothetical protein
MRVDGSVPLLVRLLILALFVGGALGALSSFLLFRDAWVWPMPDLAYRFLAGAAAAYVVGGILVWRRLVWPAIELLFASVLIYGIPLILGILIDADVIDWGKPIAWLFLAVVTPAVIISAGALWVNRDVARSVYGERLPQPLFIALVALAMVTGIVGLVVFIAPKESGIVWPWAELAAWKPLDTRLLASMLLTIAGCAALVVWRNSRVMAGILLPMLAAYGVVTSVGLLIHARKTPAMRTDDLVYAGIFITISVALLLIYRPVNPAHQGGA